MFGAHQFEGAQQFGAMDALLEAAGQTGLELPAENSSPDAVPAVPVQRIEQTVAPADLQASPQAIAEGPDIKTLDKDRLAEARKINHTNKPLGLKLGGWKPPQTKPRKQELWQVILERDSSQRPKNWAIESMVKYLIQAPLATPDEQEEHGTTTPEPETPAVATNGNTALALVPAPAVPSTEESASKQRWSQIKFVRTIHIICSEDLKSLFINRDRKLDRQEMDAKGKDAFWEKVAIVFNSDNNFDIDRQKGSQKFKTLSAAPTPYIADAAKMHCTCNMHCTDALHRCIAHATCQREQSSTLPPHSVQHCICMHRAYLIVIGVQIVNEICASLLSYCVVQCKFLYSGYQLTYSMQFFCALSFFFRIFITNMSHSVLVL